MYTQLLHLLFDSVEPSAPEKIMYAVQGICENGEINNASIRLSWNETGSKLNLESIIIIVCMHIVFCPFFRFKFLGFTLCNYFD